MILCKLGFHKKSKNSQIIFIRNENNKSFCRVDYKCERCGKQLHEYVWLPLL